MIVEFLGISGVGKTYIAKSYKSKLESEGQIVVWDTYDLYASHGWFTRNVKKGFRVLRFAIRNISWVKKYTKFLCDEVDNKRDSLRPLFNALYLKSLHEVAKKDSSVHLFDEGAMQYLWAIKMRSNKAVTKENLITMLSLFDCPDRLIIIDAEPGTIENRLKQRRRNTRIMKEGDISKKIKDMLVIQKDIESKLPETIEIIHILND